MTKIPLQAGADARCRIPADRRWDGVGLPECCLLDFANGKRTESIIELLKTAGAQ